MIQIQIKTEELENSFLLFDCTGKYSGDNRTGYGIPNYRVEDIAEYTVDVQPPSATTPYPFTVNVLDSIPNDDNTGIEIQPAQVGQTDGIESGQWKFRANVTFNTKTGGQKLVNGYLTYIFTKKIACCVDKKTAQLTDAALDDPRQKKTIELSNLLEAVYGDIECGLYDKANTTIDYMKEQCNCPSC